MRGRCSGNGLLMAGFIVTLIGLGVAVLPALDIPRYWTTAMIGVLLLLAGAVRRATVGRDETGPRSGT